jgi:hypothetical protein
VASVSILHFSDREILFKMARTVDKDGNTTSKLLAASFGFNGDPNASRAIGSRLGWMRRYGVVDKAGVGNGETLWTITSLGTQLLDATLGLAAKNELAAMADGHRVLVMEGLASRARSNKTWGALLRRSWTNGTKRVA